MSVHKVIHAGQNCGAGYSYKMTRTGKGQVAGPLLGKSEAEKLMATDEAAANLYRRLIFEFNECRCPSCGLLQDHMVRQIHKGMLRSLIWISCALISVAAVVLVVPNAHTRARDPWVWNPTFTSISVALVVLSACLPMLGLAYVKRSDPNKNVQKLNKPDKAVHDGSGRPAHQDSVHLAIRTERMFKILFENIAYITAGKTYTHVCENCGKDYSHTDVCVGFAGSAKGEEAAREKCISRLDRKVMRHPWPIGCPHCGRLQTAMIRGIFRKAALVGGSSGGFGILLIVFGLFLHSVDRIEPAQIWIVPFVVGVILLVGAIGYLRLECMNLNAPHNMLRWVTEPAPSANDAASLVCETQ